ncbi:MAG: hypothetical protein JXB10_19365 [Pirellulales bacterium]|nr:hypothetical protein [Pirellulales bacterium]
MNRALMEDLLTTNGKRGFVILGLLLLGWGCTSRKEEPASRESPPAWRAAAPDRIEEKQPPPVEPVPAAPPNEPAAEAAVPSTPPSEPAAAAETPSATPPPAVPPAAPSPAAEVPEKSPEAGPAEPPPSEDRPPAADEPVNPLRDPNSSPPVRPEPTMPSAPPAAADDAAPEPAIDTPSDIIAEDRNGRAPAGEEAAAASGAKNTAVKKPLRKGKRGDEKFDPIKENGAIFDKDWPKTPPKLAMIITGQIIGYFEPCGCAGLDWMKGGLARRNTLFRQLRQGGWPDPLAKTVDPWKQPPAGAPTGQGWPVVGLDVGNLVHGFGKQTEIKFHRMVDGMRTMGYQAVALGVNDLKLPAGEVATDAMVNNEAESLFVSANVGLLGFDYGFTAPYRIIEADGIRLGVTSVLGKGLQKEINNSEVELLDPEPALRKVLPELMAKSDYRVLLAHASMDESEALAKAFPEFNVVVTSGGPPEPPAQPKEFNDGKTLLVEVGEKGANAIVLALYDDPQKSWRYQRVPLDSRFAGAPEMKTLMAVYQDQLKTLGFTGLGLKAVPSPQKETNGKYVGSEACKSCHEESYLVWKKSKHSQAYKTLEEQDPPRNFDPECASCHVVGWNPTRYYPYIGGFESKEKTPLLKDVGCESCHGPGELHCLAEDGTDEAKQELYRKACRVTKEESKKSQCATCHDLDNSPDFDFDSYWPDVEHYEEDDE